MRNRRPFLRLLAHVGLAVFISLSLPGCGSDSRFGFVEGVVRLDGQPVTTGTVRFVPTAGRAASGTIGSDGRYVLGTYEKSDGALIGTHQVAIIAYQSTAPTGGRPDTSRPSSGTTRPLVPKHYMSPGTSGLSYDVKPGRNHWEIELTSRR